MGNPIVLDGNIRAGVTGAPAADVETVAGLASHHVLALIHAPRYVAQGRLKVISVLLLDLLFRHDVVLGTETGVDRGYRIADVDQLAGVATWLASVDRKIPFHIIPGPVEAVAASGGQGVDDLPGVSGRWRRVPVRIASQDLICSEWAVTVTQRLSTRRGLNMRTPRILNPCSPL